MQIMRQVTPSRSLQLRVSSGSPNPKEQQNMISFSFVGWQVIGRSVKTQEMYAGAFDNLAKTTEDYLSA